MTQRVEEEQDDETTAAELEHILQTEGITLSRSTILCSRRKLGWSSLLSDNQRGKQAKIIMVYGKPNK